MPTCFVIQPFDSGKFDKRYDGVYLPAIKAADLEAYRVDRDPNATVLIDAIESGIRSAAVCLADITSNNPNVWYELGYAFASGRPVVLVCGDERVDKKYPFDIQHRRIIPYASEAPSDFEQLQKTITQALRAQVEKGAALQEMAEAEALAPQSGLTQPELYVLATVAGSVSEPSSFVSVWSVQQDSRRAGLTPLGCTLGLRRLRAKAFVAFGEDYDSNGNPYPAVSLTEAAWDWIDQNETQFILKREAHKASDDDSVPF